MTYAETLRWMFHQLPMYQQQGDKAYKTDLTNITAFAAHLGNPENRLKTIHIAGTNGKGSSSHMLASILQEAGYKTGLYTSPHLKDYRERIRINGAVIDKKYVQNFIQDHRDYLENHSLSFFEMSVGMALSWFAESKVDIAVMETGLGGRLDSTNIIRPELSVITNIGFDHMKQLGNTLSEIAYEKAGIIKPGIPVIIGEKNELTAPVFSKKAAETVSPLFFAEEYRFKTYTSDLKGIYQAKNIQTVLCAVDVLQHLDWHISEKDVQTGLRKVQQNTGLQGRWQQIGSHPKIICDTGHNREGLSLVLQQLSQEKYKDLHLVLGVVNDKDLKSILPLFPKTAHYYFCKADIPRGLDAAQLMHTAKEYGLYGQSYSSVKKALAAARTKAAAEDLIFVGGSTFTVAEVL